MAAAAGVPAVGGAMVDVAITPDIRIRAALERDVEEMIAELAAPWQEGVVLGHTEVAGTRECPA